MMKQTGFTLVELVMVMVLMSILIAVAIPKYNNLTTSGETAAKAASAGAVRSALASYLASNNGVAPTNTQLEANLSGPGCSPVAAGISCTLKNGTTWTIPTYTDSGCTAATTSATTGQVLCVGG